ncbi:hypothetical protein BLX24_22745 [Arsenicibacter rosenii]|uniref:Uncharacterized protein n=2 Tax=Arsenicibacter rosenii TaxID=1750698 RepID=A0A1S2VDE9_9BACT|nr:hypothetical protein BLX24_22745 [Arsenicibacter rosenii]
MAIEHPVILIVIILICLMLILWILSSTRTVVYHGLNKCDHAVFIIDDRFHGVLISYRANSAGLTDTVVCYKTRAYATPAEAARAIERVFPALPKRVHKESTASR